MKEKAREDHIMKMSKELHAKMEKVRGMKLD